MSAGHTPGPWNVRTFDSSLGSIEAASGVQVGQAQEISVLDRNTGHSERIANTHLIAAAPELLEALRLFVKDNNAMHTERERKDFALAAIAKATGANHG